MHQVYIPMHRAAAVPVAVPVSLTVAPPISSIVITTTFSYPVYYPQTLKKNTSLSTTPNSITRINIHDLDKNNNM
jgi:hypothetical protein